MANRSFKQFKMVVLGIESDPNNLSFTFLADFFHLHIKGLLIIIFGKRILKPTSSVCKLSAYFSLWYIICVILFPLFCILSRQMVYCHLTEFQRTIYKTVLETEDVQLVLRAREPCSCNSGHKRKNCCYKVSIIFKLKYVWSRVTIHNSPLTYSISSLCFPPLINLNGS